MGKTSLGRGMCYVQRVREIQRIEHYEIAAYGTVCEYAGSMGHDEVLTLLQLTMRDEQTADATLTTLAETGINAMAGAEMDG